MSDLERLVTLLEELLTLWEYKPPKDACSIFTIGSAAYKIALISLDTTSQHLHQARWPLDNLRQTFISSDTLLSPFKKVSNETFLKNGKESLEFIPVSGSRRNELFRWMSLLECVVISPASHQEIQSRADVLQLNEMSASVFIYLKC